MLNRHSRIQSGTCIRATPATVEWMRNMKQTQWFRATGLTAIILMAGLTLAAQNSEPTDLLLKKLNEQFVPTVFNQDETDIVTPGTVVALKKNGEISGYIQDPAKPMWGMVVYRLPLKFCPISTYKNGALSMGFGDSSDTASGDNLNINAFFSFPRKYLQIGDKVWIFGFGIANKKNAVLAIVVTDRYDDGRYCGMLKFPYEKGHPPTPDDAVRMISEVLAVQPAQEQRQPPPDRASGTAPATTFLAACHERHRAATASSRCPAADNRSRTNQGPGDGRVRPALEDCQAWREGNLLLQGHEGHLHERESQQR